MKFTAKTSLFMCLFLFVSCKNMYSPIEDISHITQKKSMRPFSSLNDPIVITMPVYQKMGLMGGTADVRSKRQGDIFVVYDWESGTVYDWAFFEGNHGLSNWRAVEMGTPTKYYDAGEGSSLIGCLDPATGRVTVTQNAVQGTFANLNNNQSTKSRYGIIGTSGRENGCSTYNVNFFDSETGKVSGEKKSIFIYGSSNIMTPSVDAKGNYWMGYIEPNAEYNYLAKFCGETQSIETYRTIPVCKTSTYEVMCQLLAYDHYLLVNDGVRPLYPNVLIYDTDDMTKPPVEIEIPTGDTGYAYLGRAAYINGTLYAVLWDHSNSYARNMIYKVDVEEKKFEFLTEFNFDFTETIYVRGSRIYFLSSRKLSRLSMRYYDTATGEVSGVNAFTIDEVCANAH
ncbi:MAG TPA: hypothetical protein DCM57_00345 [Treponema sp.]|nr:hypothetical protein [Treponema sp.]